MWKWLCLWRGGGRLATITVDASPSLTRRSAWLKMWTCSPSTSTTGLPITAAVKPPNAAEGRSPSSCRVLRIQPAGGRRASPGWQVGPLFLGAGVGGSALQFNLGEGGGGMLHVHTLLAAASWSPSGPACQGG